MSPLVSTAAGGRPHEVASNGIDPHPTLDPGDVLVAVEATPLGPADFVLRACPSWPGCSEPSVCPAPAPSGYSVLRTVFRRR